MRWQAPSERVQFMLAAPIAVPAAIFCAAIILPCVALWWVLDKITRPFRPTMEWKPWFAWRPVPLGHWSRRKGWAWLERVERRARPYNWPTEYRQIGDTDSFLDAPKPLPENQHG